MHNVAYLALRYSIRQNCEYCTRGLFGRNVAAVAQGVFNVV
jgi:hypothetical protein